MSFFVVWAMRALRERKQPPSVKRACVSRVHKVLPMGSGLEKTIVFQMSATRDISDGRDGARSAKLARLTHHIEVKANLATQ